MQSIDVPDVLFVCLAGDVQKGIAICLKSLNLTPYPKNSIVTFTAYTRELIAPIPV